MFIKFVTVLFYVGITLWAFGVTFPFLMVIIGLCALVLAVVAVM